MRHRKANVKLGRTASHRDAMLRNMVTSLFEYDRIVTTISKAKALRPLADHMIGLAKNGKGDLHAFRQAAAVITKRAVLDKVFDEAATRFNDRPCGYTIMVKSGLRKGDAAPMVILELIKPETAKAKVGGGASAAARKAKAGGDRSKRVAQSAKKAAAAPAAEEAANSEPQPRGFRRRRRPRPAP
jgi:large subunit ribosomal protein L17